MKYIWHSVTNIDNFYLQLLLIIVVMVPGFCNLIGGWWQCFFSRATAAYDGYQTNECAMLLAVTAFTFLHTYVVSIENP